MRVLGIDPGLSGALAVVDTCSDCLLISDIPTVTVAHGKGKRAHINAWAMRRCIVNMGPIDLAIIEKVSAMPRQGVTSTFRFGYAAGFCLGVVTGLGIRTELVTPQAWKKAMKVGREKDQARQIITDLYPFNVDSFTRKKDVDRAEAALIAVYGLRTIGAPS